MPGLDIQLEQSEMTILYAKKSVAGGEIPRLIYSFFRAIDMNLWLSG